MAAEIYYKNNGGWSKIQAADIGALDSTNQRTWYGTCNTVNTTSEKKVTCENYNLQTGNIITILFSTSNTTATPTLNINSTGAKDIYIGASALDSNNTLKWPANTLMYFIYDGTYYRYLGTVAAASNDNNPPRGANVWYGTCSTSASTQTKLSNIVGFSLTKGAIAVIAFSYANTYTSDKLALTISSSSNSPTSTKDIWYNGAVTSSTNTLKWKAKDILTFIYDGTYWRVIGISSATAAEDYVIDMGQRNLSPDDTDYFIWEKWHSGKITISGQQPVNLSNITWSQWGSLYYYTYQGLSINTTLLSSLNLINPPQIFVSWVGTGHDAWCGISKLNISGTQTIDTTKQLPYITIYRGSASNNLEGWIYYQLIGQTDLTQS